MAHGSPRVLGVCSEVSSPILADNESRCSSSEGQVHQTVLVDCGFESVSGSFFVEGQGDVVGCKGEHALIEHVIVQGIGVPVMRTIAFDVEYFRVKLGSGMDTSDRSLVEIGQMVPTSSRDVAVNNLNHNQGTIIGHNVKGLSLDIGIVIGTPAKVFLG